MTDRTYMEGLTVEQHKDLEARIRSAILATQEKCAQVADKRAKRHAKTFDFPPPCCDDLAAGAAYEECVFIASAIRALKMETGHE